MQPSVSPHEKEIFAHFGRAPERCQVTRTLSGKGVFVLFTNRSGSTYFADLLNQLPDLRLVGELFNSDQLIQRCTSHDLTSFDDYVQWLRPKRQKAAWGSKVGIGQLEMLYRFGLFQAFEGGSQLLWIKRRNVIAQAVSLFIASTTRQWTSFQGEAAPPPDYDYCGITRLIRGITQHNADAEVSLAALGLPYMTLYYEDLLYAPQYHMRRAAKFIGIPCEGISTRKTRVKRQEDPVKEAYVERYLEEMRREKALDGDPYHTNALLRRALEE